MLDKLAQDLKDANEAAKAAAAASSDGGSCNLDFVVLSILRTRGLTKALNDSGVRWKRRADRAGSIAIYPDGGGQAAKRTKACEAMVDVLKGRGWSCYVCFVTD